MCLLILKLFSEVRKLVLIFGVRRHARPRTTDELFPTAVRIRVLPFASFTASVTKANSKEFVVHVGFAVRIEIQNLAQCILT